MKKCLFPIDALVVCSGLMSNLIKKSWTVSNPSIFLRIKENMSQGPSVKSLKIMVHSKPQQVVIGHQDLENYVHVETCMKIFMICIT